MTDLGWDDRSPAFQQPVHRTATRDRTQMYTFCQFGCNSCQIAARVLLRAGAICDKSNNRLERSAATTHAIKSRNAWACLSGLGRPHFVTRLLERNHETARSFSRPVCPCGSADARRWLAEQRADARAAGARAP